VVTDEVLGEIGREILCARSGATVARRVVRDEQVVLQGKLKHFVGLCRVLKVERGLERRAGVLRVERGVVLRLEVYGGDLCKLSRRRR
jgi:hypothetical protein